MLLVALVAMAASCCNCRTQKSARLPLVGTEWKLAQIGGQTVSSENYRVTFAADGTLSGIGDCNRFSGSYSLADGSLTVGDNLVATRMMCLGQAQEDRFLAMLKSADAYAIDGVRLMLITGGEVVAVFDSAVAPTE